MSEFFYSEVDHPVGLCEQGTSMLWKRVGQTLFADDGDSSRCCFSPRAHVQWLQLFSWDFVSTHIDP